MFIFTHWTSNCVEPATRFPSRWSQQKQDSSAETNTAHSYKKPAHTTIVEEGTARREVRDDASVSGQTRRHKLGQWGRREAGRTLERDRSTPDRPIQIKPQTAV